ncbi:helix-turn-helix transcriptional regulator [Ralstonia pseudosolanacearum]|uniref:XRE family transcriptional regulator n=2 Tax=Ralstonia solanacearum species complex TaxID=3116862 RepID=A0ABX7ZSJ6_9RALS|nr:XRE family transcriptional regulator [Ralstonia solanacearum]QUP57887.1 XRE family transcriptional regulator [Ralstonia nicotianae]UQY81451.1 helix-turn-helix transcriptional regulator [Ralstonia pseudosolanacearum]
MERMEFLGERLTEERKRKGLNQTEFGALGGVSVKTQVLYEKSERAPDANYLMALAEGGIDVLYVLTGKHSAAELAPDEEMVLTGYRKLDARGRSGVLALIGGIQPQAEKKVKKTRNEMVFHGSVGDVKNISGDYHETRHQTVHTDSGKKKRTDKDD